jgi:hypothetical protein
MTWVGTMSTLPESDRWRVRRRMKASTSMEAVRELLAAGEAKAAMDRRPEASLVISVMREKKEGGRD